MRHYTKYDFKNLLNDALSCRFWNEKNIFDRKGKFAGIGYEVNNLNCLYFLNKMGFWKYKTLTTKEGYIYIKIDGNIVKQVTASEIREFIDAFAAKRHLDRSLRNQLLRTKQLSGDSLSRLAAFEPDFTDFDSCSQYLFFQNGTWKVTKEGIVKAPIDEYKRFVWSDEVIKHDVEILPEMFRIYKKSNEYEIENINSECKYLKFLQCVSEIYWKEGSNKTHRMIQEERQHLINKIYIIGYMLHRFKDPSKAYAPFIMDARHNMDDDEASHGGTGKSLFAQAFTYLLPMLTIGGRTKDLLDKHIFTNVAESTDIVYIDDIDKYHDMAFFYTAITGNLDVNAKWGSMFKLEAERSPKFMFSSNFPPRGANTDSTLRRLIFCIFSDYFHENVNDHYENTVKPKDVLGIRLYIEFDEKQWNLFYNFMAQCLVFYLNTEDKINPPGDTIQTRILLNQIGNNFHEWADVFFSKESGRLDKAIEKRVCFEAYTRTGMKPTGQSFRKSLEAWCKHNKYILNPKDIKGWSERGRIIQWHEGESCEMIFIRTPEIIEENNLIESKKEVVGQLHEENEVLQDSMNEPDIF
jgi:hypothetical protein